MTTAGTVGTIIAAAFAFVAAGCGGPLDTPDPRPRRDAGVDTGSGGRRVVDAAPDLTVRDARPIPDVPVRDAGSDADSGVDTQWPVVPGCVTGLPPSPQISPETIPPLNVSCGSSSTLLTRLLDPAGHGLVYDAELQPQIQGLSLSFSGYVCSFNNASEIDLNVDGTSVLPGTNFSSRLVVTVHGPPPQTSQVFPFQIATVPIEFDVDPAVIDFGVVPSGGQFLSIPVMVTNAKSSLPLSAVYPTQTFQPPFQLFVNNGAATPLQPGDTQPLLTASFLPSMPGTYDTTFLVSGFPPGTSVNIACGVVRTITMHAQVVQLLPPG